MFQIVDRRRERTLPFAIEIFNKIQGINLPKWDTPESKLNIKKNPNAQTKFDMLEN